MADQLSGIAIIICIAFGSLTGILLFVFAKRQIMRFALKSRSGPHVPIAYDASKCFRHEIERRLSAVKYIRYHPYLLNELHRDLFCGTNSESKILPKHLYRMKVVDEVRELCVEITSGNTTKYHCTLNEDLSSYFLKFYKDGILPSTEIETVYKFLLKYQHARYEPKDFTYNEYCQFTELLQLIKKMIPERKEVNVVTHSFEDESRKPLLKRLNQTSTFYVNSELNSETPV